MKHFLQLSDWSKEDLRHTLDVAKKLKKQLKQIGRNEAMLTGKMLAMVFEKPSLRTRVSFAVAMEHLGGAAMMLRQEEVGLGYREPVKDVARVLSSMCNGILVRTFEQSKVDELAEYSSVPVINGLTDLCHPCQAMADIMTLEEHFGDLKGRTVAFIGDGNNVARSLAVACGKFGMRFILATPPAYALPKQDIDRIMAQVPELDFVTTNDPRQAAKNADCLYTDTWVSMGQEAEKQQRIKEFAGFSIDEKLLAIAPKDCVVMHCLPAYRGLEISDSAVEGKQSLIFPQAENRLHFQKGLIAVVMAGQ